MSEAENKATVRRFYEAFAHLDIEAAGAMLADDFVDHTAPPGIPEGREGALQVAAMLMNAFPQQQIVVDLLVAEGDYVAAVHTHEGVHSGPYMGIPPTSQRFRINGIEVFRLADGKITELWRRDDELGALMQLGIIPPLGA